MCVDYVLFFNCSTFHVFPYYSYDVMNLVFDGIGNESTLKSPPSRIGSSVADGVGSPGKSGSVRFSNDALEASPLKLSLTSSIGKKANGFSEVAFGAGNHPTS